MEPIIVEGSGPPVFSVNQYGGRSTVRNWTVVRSRIADRKENPSATSACLRTAG